MFRADNRCGQKGAQPCPEDFHAIFGCRCLCRRSVSVALFRSGDATFSRVTFKSNFQKKKKMTLKSQIKRLMSRRYLSPVWPHRVEERGLGVTPQKALRAFVLLTLITGLILFGERGYVLRLHRGLSGPLWEVRVITRA